MQPTTTSVDPGNATAAAQPPVIVSPTTPAPHPTQAANVFQPRPSTSAIWTRG